MKLYLLNLNSTEAGPFTEKQLRAMWLTGAVTINTQWRDPSESQWYDGEALPRLLESEPLGYAVSESTPAVQQRQALRSDTAYPFARGLIRTMVIIFLLGAAGSWLLALNARADSGSGTYLFPLVVTITAAGYWAAALLGLALLDVADCQLKNE